MNELAAAGSGVDAPMHKGMQARHSSVKARRAAALYHHVSSSFVCRLQCLRCLSVWCPSDFAARGPRDGSVSPSLPTPTTTQDGSDRTNRFTTSEMAQTHRELAVAPDDWFGKGIHDEGPQPGPQLPARGP